MIGRLVGMLFAVAMVAASTGCVIIPLGGLTSRAQFQEVELRKGSFGDGKILVLDVDGAISGGAEESGFFGSTDSTVVQVGEKLRMARKDDDIQAIVLRVDSPGGGVTASDIIYRDLKRYKEETKVPVYVSMLDLAASGGYYISMAADEIYAHPTTVTGSIGVIATFPNLEGLGNKIGAKMEVIKSGENKDIGAFWRQMRPEERKIMQGLIDDMYGKFVKIIAQNRTKLSEDRIRELADGRIYTADQAVAAGLVDGVMYLDEVIDHAAKATNAGKPRVVMYRKTSAATIDSLYAKAPIPMPSARGNAGGTAQVNMVNVDLGHAMTPHGEVFQYLWVP